MRTAEFQIHPEVEQALSINKPVVALESTLISHGFPYPDNLKVARAIEQSVRKGGAVPATIAIFQGKIKIGLTDDELKELAEDNSVRKCSIRDLPIVLAQEGHGTTTVAATLCIAYQAGIEVFATGGIGGVHRGAGWDVSADLIELSRTPMTVICAGMKAFLDLPATLEFLETHAVPVLGYGVAELPAFYSRQSGLRLDAQVDTPQDVAKIIQARNSLNLQNAILLTVPVAPSKEWPAEIAMPIIEEALQEAKAKNLPGKDITPFLLSRIAGLSGGQSKQANWHLLTNNAFVGAEVAQALCTLQAKAHTRSDHYLPRVVTV